MYSIHVYIKVYQWVAGKQALWPSEILHHQQMKERAAFYILTRPRIEGSVLQVVLLKITNEPRRQFPLS